MTNGTQMVAAAVSPRSLGDVSLFETTEPITAANVEGYRSSDEAIGEAVEALREQGFEVRGVGPVTIAIAGPRSLYRSVFGVTLEKQTATVEADQEVEFFAAPPDTAERLLDPPTSLSGVVEGVAMAYPPELLISPVPPVADVPAGGYQYIRVPDDVGLATRADRVHRMGGTGRGVRVAMVDTGFVRQPFYTWHGYRVKSTVLGPSACEPGVDAIGHGTGEAANIFATAPDVELMPVKDMFNKATASCPGDIKGAFDTAAALHPHVITNSWSYSVDSQSWTQLKNANPGLWAYLVALAASVATAVADGIVVCFSAGNGHLAFPASHPDVIAVGGVHVDPSDMTFEASSYASSFDSQLYPGRHVPDVCGLCGNGPYPAPLIMLPVPAGSDLDLANTGSTNDGWGIFSGTSASCPQVAGVAALLRERNENITPAGIRTILANTARDITEGSSSMGDDAGPGDDDATGAGLVDAKWAWINTMVNVATAFFEAPPEKQAAMVAAGQMPRVPREFMDDVFTSLRSRT